MKKTIFALLIFNCSFLIVNAQWLPEVRLTNANGNSNLYYTRCIATNQNSIHVVWYDDRDGNYEIYYKRSTDRGTTWDPDTRLTNNTSFSMFPTIVLSGTNIYIAWNDFRDGNYEIYYKISTNNGLIWGNDIRLTNTSDRSRLPALAVNNSNVYIVWEEKELYTDICFKRSTNGGLSWSNDTVLDNSSISSENPCISLFGSVIHAVWEDDRNGYGMEVYYKRSDNEGVNWSQDIRLTTNSGESLYPFIEATASNVNLVFQDNFTYHNEIYYLRSTNGGLMWEPVVNLSNITNESWHPYLSSSGSIVHLVWYAYFNDTPRICYKRSINEGINWNANVLIPAGNNAIAAVPAISVMDSMLHLIWIDFRDGNSEIYYKCNLNGNIVNLQNINFEIPEHFSLSQNYPNPFNPTTKIKFNLPSVGQRYIFDLQVKLAIYDILGREITLLLTNI